MERPTLLLDATRYIVMKDGIPHTRVMTIDDDLMCQKITDYAWIKMFDGGIESVWRRPELPACQMVNQSDENGLPLVNSGTKSGKPTGKPEAET